jgi:hypothetical protein
VPRIPSYVATETLPAASGMRSGVLSPPVGQDALVRDSGPTAVEQSLTALPQAAIVAGDLEARRAAAQALLDGKTQFQDLRPLLRDKLEDMKANSPYQTLPKDFLDEANQMIEARAQGLTGQARAIFVEAAKQELVPLHLEASRTYSDRRDQAATQSAITESNWFQKQYQQAGNDADRAYYKQGLTDLMTKYRDAGIFHGDTVAKFMIDLEEKTQVAQAHMLIRTKPSEALHDIYNRMNGKPATLPAIAEVPVTQLVPLFDEATKQLEHQVVWKEAENTRQKRALQEQQSMRASQYRDILYKPGITIPELVGLLEPLKEDRSLQKLGENDHAQLLGNIQTLMQKLQDDAYKDRDVPSIAKDAIIRIETAQTPDQLASVQQWLRTQVDNLSSGTLQARFAHIAQRMNADDPLNDDLGKEARRLFLSGAFPGGIVPAVMDKLNDGIKSKTALGLDLLNTELRDIYTTQGKEAYRKQALDVGRRFKDLFFPESGQQQGGVPANLPPTFEGIKYFEDAYAVLSGLDLPQAARRQLFLQIKESYPRKPVEAPPFNIPQVGGVPQVPALQLVPGYQPPRAGTAGPYRVEERPRGQYPPMQER